jgi:hypothetical protein
MNATRDDQRGSVLIIAIIAMMIMGILSISFALLARVEVAIGVNYKSQAQAEALAEAGLERARDLVRGADAEPCGFTRWTDSASNSYGCGSYVSPPTETLGAGSYTFVIDNDCPTLVPDTAKLKDSQCGGAGVTQPYPTSGVNRDTNQIAVVTAWATTSTANAPGRARVRAILGIDNPWRHVCASSSQDNPPGYCNEPANRNGNPTITPADPNEYPGGPQAYDDLPRPQLGCSRIDVTLHGETVANCPPGQNYNKPYPVGKRLVIQGDATKGNCGTFGGITFSGYFDCALTTPCEAPACSPTRKACVPAADPRLLSDSSRYFDASTPGGCAGNTGMVFTSSVDWNNNGNNGSTGNGRNMYVMNGTFSLQKDTFHGTIAIEGDGAGNDDLQHKNQAILITEQNNTTHGQPVYGYPLAYLVYDPELPAPTANPLVPQATTGDMGSAAGTEIHGIVYSGGHMAFNPVVVDGGIVSFEIQTQASSSTYGYNTTYGDAAPPAGFPVEQGNQVVIIKKSFVVCGNYAAGSGTACE